MKFNELYFATSNSWKFKQAKNYFCDRGISLKQYKINIEEPREEDGFVIAKFKAHTAYNELMKPLFVLDGSFEIKALNGFPKTYVKLLDKYIGTAGILKLLDNEKDRRWEFHNILYFKGLGIEKNFDGVTCGEISKRVVSTKKTMVRDFERILIPEGYTKSFSQMTQEEYNDYNNTVWKHKVFNPFIEWFKK